MKNLFIDTNVILLDANNLFTIQADYPDYNICLSEVVINELDSKKTVVGELGYQAREFGRIISKAQKIPSTLEHSEYKVAAYKNGNLTINIFAKNHYSISDLSLAESVNDSMIIESAKDFNGLLMSNDVMCRIRAEMQGLEVTDFKHVEHVDYEFTKHILLSHNKFNTLHNTEINLIDPSYELTNFSYMFESTETGETKLATVQNGLIKVIGKDSERDLRNQYVNPANKEQLLLSALVQDRSYDITICEALAGSGKTLVSISNAMKLVDANIGYDSIIYIRNTVNDSSGPDEEIGFLKGDKNDKTADIVAPFYDSVATIAGMVTNTKLRGKEFDDYIETEVETLMTKYNMKARVSLGLRGLTIHNSVIIIDEAQNISKKTMQKILSRVGKNCKVIVIGSLRQIDSKYLTKYTSGLSVLLDTTNRTDLPAKVNAVTLHKVVRGKITEFSEIVFANQKE